MAAVVLVKVSEDNATHTKPESLRNDLSGMGQRGPAREQ